VELDLLVSSSWSAQKDFLMYERKRLPCRSQSELADESKPPGIPTHTHWWYAEAIRYRWLVHICTPNFLLFAQAKAVFTSWKAMWSAKSLWLFNLNEAEDWFLWHWERLGQSVHFNLRYYPLVVRWKPWREKGELGEVYSVMGLLPFRIGFIFKTDYNWRLEPDQSGDQSDSWYLVRNLLDMTEYVTGLKITAVMADFSYRYKTRLKPLKAIETFHWKNAWCGWYKEYPGPQKDYAYCLTIRFDNGRTGSITVLQVNAGRKKSSNCWISGSKVHFEFNTERPQWAMDRKAEKLQIAFCLKDQRTSYLKLTRLWLVFPRRSQWGVFQNTPKQIV